MAVSDLLPHVLYLTHRVPYPPDKGDRIRNFHVFRELTKIARVDLACLSDEPITDDTRSTLEKLSHRLAIVPVSGKRRWLKAGWSLCTGGSLTEGLFAESAFEGQIRSWTEATSYDAAIVSTSGLAPYLRKKHLRHVPAIVDLVDVDSQKWFDYADHARPPKSWLYRLEGRRVRKLEQSLVAWAKAITIVSPAECQVFDSFTRPGAGTMATNGVDMAMFQPRPAVAPKKACAFVGAMDYRPNIDASIWFADTIWPAIREKHPDAEFWIIGRKPTPAVESLAQRPGIVVTGSVPDVREYLAEAAMAVCPIRIARGLQNKVLEAMAMAKATIAAPPAVAALNTVDGKHLLVARDPAEWVTAVCQLFDDPARRLTLGQAAREYVESHHHWDRCLQVMMDRVLAVCREPKLKA